VALDDRIRNVAATMIPAIYTGVLPLTLVPANALPVTPVTITTNLKGLASVSIAIAKIEWLDVTKFGKWHTNVLATHPNALVQIDLSVDPFTNPPGGTFTFNVNPTIGPYDATDNLLPITSLFFSYVVVVLPQ
jgi:hypothetical protein